MTFGFRRFVKNPSRKERAAGTRDAAISSAGARPAGARASRTQRLDAEPGKIAGARNLEGQEGGRRMREDRRHAECGQERMDEQAAADAGDRRPAVFPPAAQRVAHDEEGVRARRDRHQCGHQRESEDLRVQEVHGIFLRKQPTVWSFTIPTACMNA